MGKTAVTGHLARLLARDRDVLVVAMGRGGPLEPEVVEVAPTIADLLERSRAGRHAASDHLETAAIAGVPTIGCRRCGGGLAGATFVSNVSAGMQVAVDRGADIVVFDGSGAAIPPVATAARILVAHDLVSGLNPYRALISDLVLSTTGEVVAEAEALGGGRCSSTSACGRSSRSRAGGRRCSRPARPCSIMSTRSSSRRRTWPIATRSDATSTTWMWRSFSSS